LGVHAFEFCCTKTNLNFPHFSDPMNLKRFQFAVNHEDIRVVLAGLKEFKDYFFQEERDLKNFFICVPYELDQHGGSNVVFGRVDYAALQPFLNSLFESSPELAELFALWDFPTIDYDAELCIMDLDCLTTIIESLPKGSHHLSIINQINNRYTNFLMNQLDKKKLPLSNSILRLMIAVQRKAHLTDDFIHHILLTNMIDIKKQKNDDDDDVYGEERTVQSEDGHFFAIKLVFTVLIHADFDVALQLLSHGPNIDAMINKLSDVSSASFSLFLAGLLYLCEHGARLQEQLTQKLLNTQTTQKIILATADNPDKHHIFNGFLQAIFRLIAVQIASEESRHMRTGLTAYFARRYAAVIVATLDPVTHPKHGKVRSVDRVKVDVLLLPDL
jgi:hypothetical protein